MGGSQSRVDLRATFDVIRWLRIEPAINAKGAKRCLRTHPSTVTAGLLPLGPDPVRLDPPRLETAFRPCFYEAKRKGRIIQLRSPLGKPRVMRLPISPRNNSDSSVNAAFEGRLNSGVQPIQVGGRMIRMAGLQGRCCQVTATSVFLRFIILPSSFCPHHSALIILPSSFCQLVPLTPLNRR